MEGVGARLGRSSTRYGPATVFSGPVRKWKKMWVHVAPPNSSTSSKHVVGNNSNGSHLVLFKWSPTNQSSKDGSSPSAAAATVEEQSKRRFRYVPASAKNQVVPAESNEANLDLNLVLKSHEGDCETDSKMEDQNEGV
ncbi:hypothetical protein QJS04_geneDACA005205 [Acorus gramineus]|uniref:Uncharacterized protein n=1 Tax=Acorus gramineus TaxID=55184 RepID=A0AAV9AZN4_ACOGR|nr:hypothetical protein QJS04_geneDACA005205 [Acorus gramineus]